jgi:dihydrodipicolinate synthase/N-acetylneuraminate lyase
MPVGVVAGPANALPREWAWAWQVCRAGDEERMAAAQRVVDAFRDGTVTASGKRTLACLKRALYREGVISSACVAPGTPELTRPDAERFDLAFEGVKELAANEIGDPWTTRFERRSD